MRAVPAAAFTVDVTDGKFTFMTADGKYLTSLKENNLTLEPAASDYSKWVLETADGGWLLRNDKAVRTSNGKPVYLEYYSGFTTYSYKRDILKRIHLSFYEVVPAATLMTAPPADNEQFVIWYNAGNQIISASAIPAGGRLDGVNSAPVGEAAPRFMRVPPHSPRTWTAGRGTTPSPATANTSPPAGRQRHVSDRGARR